MFPPGQVRSVADGLAWHDLGSSLDRRGVTSPKGEVMSGKADKAKGRVKEAIGALTGDRKLKRQGRIDQAAGDVKDASEKMIDRIKNNLSR
jgi:uncharacterized protein YjbJ (UPF0337 family)